MPGVTEEGVDRIVSSSNGFVAWRLHVRLETMLEAKEFPPRISTLEVSVADVDEEGVESLISSSTGFVEWRLHVRSDNVLEASGLPPGTSALDVCMAGVSADCLALCRRHLRRCSEQVASFTPGLHVVRRHWS